MAHVEHPQISVAEIEPGYLSSLFPCEAPECEEVIKGEIAQTAVLFARGRFDQSFFERLEARGVGGFFSVYEFPVDHRYLDDFRRLHRESPTFTCPISVDVYPFAERAFRHGDRVAVDYYAKLPFMCQTCEGIYCAAHFHLEGIPADEFDDRTFLRKIDYWDGTCPNGHPYFLA